MSPTRRDFWRRHTSGMKLVEAWDLSRTPYREVVYKSLAEERGRMWWGAFGKNQTDEAAQNDLELTKRALRIAKFDKLIVAVFNMVVSVVPFIQLLSKSSFLGLLSSISLSLAISFGFTTLYGIQTLSSFVTSESSTLLSTLPMMQDDFSLVTLFSFIRSIDYIVTVSILGQVILVAYITASPLAVLMMLAASTMNSVLAVTIALWFSRIFQKNLFRGGRSRINSALRLAFILMWGLLLMGVGLLFSMPGYVIPNLLNVMNVSQLSSLLLSLIYPFSASIIIAGSVYSSLTSVLTFPASCAMVGYLILMAIAVKWSLGTVRRIQQGAAVKIIRAVTNDFSVKPRTPLVGYIIKDLKVASRNPATAFFFALPVLEVVIISLLVSSFVTLRTTAILIASFMGGVFALLLPLALLSAEGKGLEYTKTLPIDSYRIVVSKAAVTTLTYLSVPLTLDGLAVIKPFTSQSSIFIPFLIVFAVASASVFEIKLFLSAAAKGKIAAVTSDVKKLFVGTLTLLAPVVAYATVFFFSFGHILSLLAMIAVTVSELAIAVCSLRLS